MDAQLVRSPAVVGMVAVMLKVGPEVVFVPGFRLVLRFKVQVSRAPATPSCIQDAESRQSTGETAVAVTPAGSWSCTVSSRGFYMLPSPSCQ